MKKKILICYYSVGNVTVKYEDFAEEFLKNGHDVICCNSKIFDVDLVEKLDLFNPDLTFSFNNILPKAVVDKLDCPVVVIDSDNPQMFFNKDNVHHPKLIFFGCQSNSKELYENILNVRLNSSNYLYLSFNSSNLKPENLTQDINISFIGYNFYHKLSARMVDYKKILEQAKVSLKDLMIDDCGYYEQKYDFVNHIFTSQKRLEFLSVLTDLGLQIYGNSTWDNVDVYSYKIANCFVKEEIVTKAHNQNIYNRSKISINISHDQAVNAFSWRASDIMTSNSCLVMEDKKDWHDLFGKYISTKVKDAIIYKDRYDMREKCIKLLKDEDLRLRCVEECQNAMEKNGRWKYRIKEIEDFLKIKLINDNAVKNIGNFSSIYIPFTIPQKKTTFSLYKN